MHYIGLSGIHESCCMYEPLPSLNGSLRYSASNVMTQSNCGLLVKALTMDRKIQGSSPTSSRDLFLFWVHSALPQKLSRRFSFASFGGDVKPSVLGNPLKLA